MSVRRFLVPPGSLDAESVAIEGELYRHAVKVLRLKAGARVLLADGRGRERGGIVTEIGRTNLVVTLEEDQGLTAIPEKGVRIALYQGLPKGEKLDFILQKGTELGATAIVPFAARRTVVRIPPDQREERLERWRRIVREASRQSGRASVPEVSLAADLDEVLRTAHHPVKLLLWEEERERGLKEMLAQLPEPGSVAVLIGPEGGFTVEEAKRAQAAGFVPVTLGRRILRTETAGLALLAILQFVWGDVG
ncbi:MAG TPA: 16S rRNA (uracil(1498)-N(3))-methyltransferase [Geobacteraceae bacterium]